MATRTETLRPALFQRRGDTKGARERTPLPEAAMRPIYFDLDALYDELTFSPACCRIPATS
jgi:hypothetical protein